MPEVGDIVLYRLVVSEFYGIEKERKIPSARYVL